MPKRSKDQRPPAPKTNMELVEEYMNWGNPLKQAFVMEAIGRYAKQVVDNRDKLIKDMENSMINGEAWVECAEEWIKQQAAAGRTV